MSGRHGRAALVGWPAGRLAILALAGAALSACGAPEEDAGAGAANPQGQEWVALFDGADLSAWRGYRRDDVPAGWQAREGTLVFVPGGDGGDLVTREQFDDFELALDWRVQPGGNSGVLYRATEDSEEIWHGAPEMQVLDDARHPDGQANATSAGAAYALYPAPAGVVRPAGEWNAARIVARGPHVEHWLNGVKIVEYEVGSDDWNRRVAASKFAEFPAFGVARRGHIGLQDHGDTVWFRDIRIRPLPPRDSP